MQFVGPPGHDSTILSLLLAVETLFGDFPAPPNPSVCSGCVSNVTVQQVMHPCDMRANTHASDLMLRLAYVEFDADRDVH